MKTIDKATFNRLNIKEQVKIFNSMLQEDKNIKTVCEAIGISYSTVRDRFNKAQYHYNKYTNCYEKNIRTYGNEKLENEIKTSKITIDKDDNVTVRSFRVRQNILDDFIKYCENSMLKQYDVLSLFLLEGMEKYR